MITGMKGIKGIKTKTFEDLRFYPKVF